MPWAQTAEDDGLVFPPQVLQRIEVCLEALAEVGPGCLHLDAKECFRLLAYRRVTRGGGGYGFTIR